MDRAKIKLYFRENKRKIVLRCSIILIVLFVINHVAIAWNPLELYGCVSITFDKWEMNHADKIELISGEKTVEITDKEVFKELIKQTTVTNYQDGCKYREDIGRRIKIYYHGRVVREMIWYDEHNEIVQVYSADIKHWIPFSKTGEGYIYLPGEFKLKLLEYIETH